jgi:hypothetical protein
MPENVILAMNFSKDGARGILLIGLITSTGYKLKLDDPFLLFMY